MEIHLTKQEAIDFFSELFGGDHHIPGEVKECGYGFQVTSSSDMSTYDGNKLTRLVLMAHEKCIRAEIQGSNFGKIKIMIWKRQRDGVSISNRHPTIEQAIESYRK